MILWVTVEVEVKMKRRACFWFHTTKIQHNVELSIRFSENKVFGRLLSFCHKNWQVGILIPAGYARIVRDVFFSAMA